MNTTYHVTHLYANKIYKYDKNYAMILISSIKTFIFVRDVIIQMNDVIIFLTKKPAEKVSSFSL